MELGHPTPRIKEREKCWWLCPPWSWDDGITEWPGLEGTSQGAQLVPHTACFFLPGSLSAQAPLALPCQSPGHGDSSPFPPETPPSSSEAQGLL